MITGRFTATHALINSLEKILNVMTTIREDELCADKNIGSAGGDSSLKLI